ncbi:MAG: hypothetical protein V3V08_23700 [Nannocystaceae bacterium]
MVAVGARGLGDELKGLERCKKNPFGGDGVILLERQIVGDLLEIVSGFFEKRLSTHVAVRFAGD